MKAIFLACVFFMAFQGSANAASATLITTEVILVQSIGNNSIPGSVTSVNYREFFPVATDCDTAAADLNNQANPANAYAKISDAIGNKYNVFATIKARCNTHATN